METLKKFGTLGVVMIVAVASLMLGVTPARADGYVRYENVGNPGWCMSNSAKLERCDGSNGQRWWWSVATSGYWRGKITLRTVNRYPDGNYYCLTTGAGPRPSVATLQICKDTWAEQHFTIWGQNGWVLIGYAAPEGFRGECLRPYGTDQPGKEAYNIQLFSCPPSLANVPNIFAWRYSQ
ncbi:hypothetical protein [Saccharothrix stipae]